MSLSKYMMALALLVVAMSVLLPAKEVNGQECTSMLDYIMALEGYNAFKTGIAYFNVEDRFSDPNADLTFFLFTDDAFEKRMEESGVPSGSPVEALLSRVPPDRFDAAFAHHFILAGKDIDTLLEEEIHVTVCLVYSPSTTTMCVCACV